jgi:endonuclease/exonuclease/phosphatase family metal-dependent hydrolase
MARSRKTTEQSAKQIATAFFQMPMSARIAVVVLILVGAAIFVAVSYQQQPAPHSIGEKGILLCHWNMENLFDDIDHPRRQPDEAFDNWFVEDPAARELKYQRLTEALLRLNDGIGPDIIVGNEIETFRAAELLKNSLNASLTAGAAKYEYVAMEEQRSGRHIAPCVISRYPLSRAKLLGSRQRILEVFVTVNGHELHLVASHWTSQLSDKGDDNTRGRHSYANVIHETYTNAIRKNPHVDFLVAGDFNASPDANSIVNHLHMTGERSLVSPDAHPPRLFGLLSNKSPDDFGTLYYSGRLSNGQQFSGPLIYDHIAISPGLFDQQGWECLPDSVQVPTEGLIRSGSRTRRPWRFGTKNDDAQGRGYSDHFPVVVTLKVEP